jgi:predicted DNA-binding protein YlxM (UPF0122 family)
MAKISDKQWEKAKLLYENGNSLRKIALESGINHQTINDRAKKEGWNPDKIRQQIVEQTRVEAKFLTLEKNEQELVRSEVNKRLEGMEFYASKARETVNIGLKSFKRDPSAMGMKTILEGLKAGMQVEGIVPFYQQSSTPVALQINNNPDLRTYTKEQLDEEAKKAAEDLLQYVHR